MSKITTIPKRTAGKCPICHHYGSDCTGPHEVENTTQHTPGPWQYMADSLEIVRADDVQPVIATVHLDNTSEAQAIADARLIAAAPELLAAAFELIEAHEWEATEYGSGICECRVHKAHAALKAAIAKAEAGT